VVDSVTFSTPLGGRSVTLTADQLDAAARGGQALRDGAEQERLIEDDLPEFLRIYEEARWRYLTAKDAVEVHKMRGKELKAEQDAALKALSELKPPKRQR
jgi:hypothetical protein